MHLFNILTFSLIISAAVNFSGSPSSKEINKAAPASANIYKYMSGMFKGHPSSQEIQILANGALVKFSKPINHHALNSLGAHLFSLRKSTGYPETTILDCLLASSSDIVIFEAANRCAGYKPGEFSYSL